eukprot:Hpha_TRINITY_DN16845_c1_g2::TRINITY_DN16845_c1_g2_i1::g.149917::m.149917
MGDLGIDVLQGGEGVPLVWQPGDDGEDVPAAVIDPLQPYHLRLTNSSFLRTVAQLAVNSADTGVCTRLEPESTRTVTMPPPPVKGPFSPRVDVAFFDVVSGEWTRASAPRGVATVYLCPAGENAAEPPPPPPPPVTSSSASGAWFAGDTSHSTTPPPGEEPTPVSHLVKLLSTARADGQLWKERAFAAKKEADQWREEATRWKRRFQDMKRSLESQSASVSESSEVRAPRTARRISNTAVAALPPDPGPLVMAALPQPLLNARRPQAAAPHSARAAAVSFDHARRQAAAMRRRKQEEARNTAVSSPSQSPQRPRDSSLSRERDASGTLRSTPARRSPAARRPSPVHKSGRTTSPGMRGRSTPTPRTPNSPTPQPRKPSPRHPRPSSRSPARAGKAEGAEIDWADVTARLPYQGDESSTKRRKKLFRAIDVNGNGQLSLAEIDKGLRDVLRLPQVFDAKPAVMLAYKIAKGSSSRGDDLVDRKEFRVLLCALRQCFEMWVIFERVDTSADRRIGLDEFKRAVPVLMAMGAPVTDETVEKVFGEIDKDGHGMVLFEEFAEWGLQNALDLPDDDDASVDDLPTPEAVGGRRRAHKDPSTTAAEEGHWKKIDWPRVTASLPSGTGEEAKKKRRMLFNSMDGNGNGLLSLAEIDRGVRDVLRLDGLFDAKPAIMMAYKVAKNSDRSKGADDLVSRTEFRVLLAALRRYFEFWVMFAAADSDHDKRVSREEFRRALPLIEAFGGRVTDVDAAFAEIDRDGHGMILFEEFAEWAVARGLDLPDDDDAPEEDLPAATGFQRHHGAMSRGEGKKEKGEGADPQWQKIDWPRVTASLPSGTGEEAKKKRRMLFNSMDGNGNGLLS